MYHSFGYYCWSIISFLLKVVRLEAPEPFTPRTTSYAFRSKINMYG